MKKILVTAVGVMSVIPLFAADMNSTSALNDAIAKLKAEPNYSWTVKQELPSMGITPEPMEGKTEKDGFMLVTQSMNGNAVQAAFKGDKAVLKLDADWQAANAVDTSGFNGWWLAQTKSGADEAADLVSKAKAVKLDTNGVWAGDLTEAGAAELLSFRPPGATNGPPPAKDASGTVKFWVKDGELTKFESHLKGKISFQADADPMDWETIRTAEFHDLGKTKVEVPAEAKAKLEAK